MPEPGTSTAGGQSPLEDLLRNVGDPETFAARLTVLKEQQADLENRRAAIGRALDGLTEREAAHATAEAAHAARVLVVEEREAAAAAEMAKARELQAKHAAIATKI